MSFAPLKPISLCLLLLLPLSSNADSTPRVYCEADIEEKVIAITFDDGPHYKYTEEILDILGEYDVKGTFFTVGENAVKFPELIERELNEGHEVGNHTYSHVHMNTLKGDELLYELLEWEKTAYTHNEYTTSIFRPPEGIVTDEEYSIISNLGYDVILWSVDTRDWAHTPSDKIIENVLSNVTGGSIILFHDFVSGNSPTPEALRKLIPKLKEMGYTFATVSELIAD